MNKATDAKVREVKPIIGFRPKDIAPVINIWLEKNPHMDISDLVRDSLRRNPDLKKLAGKRYAHLVAA